MPAPSPDSPGAKLRPTSKLGGRGSLSRSQLWLQKIRAPFLGAGTLAGPVCLNLLEDIPPEDRLYRVWLLEYLTTRQSTHLASPLSSRGTTCNALCPSLLLYLHTQFLYQEGWNQPCTTDERVIKHQPPSPGRLSHWTGKFAHSLSVISQ